MGQAERIKVKELVVRILEVEVEPTELADDEPLFGDGFVADSMVVLELVAAIEGVFGIKVTDEELCVELFESLQVPSEYVEEKVESGRGLWDP